MDKNDDDSNWREEYRGMKVLTKYQVDLLENGPKSLAQSWAMGAMHNDWKKKKGIKEPDPPDCQSNLKDSLKKFNEIYDDHSDPYGGY